MYLARPLSSPAPLFTPNWLLRTGTLWRRENARGVVEEHGFQEIFVHVEDLRTVGGTEYLGPSLEDHVARHGGRVGVPAPVRLLAKHVWEEVVERVDDVWGRLVDEVSIVELSTVCSRERGRPCTEWQDRPVELLRTHRP